MPWRCFLAELSEFCRRSLRRYAGSKRCSLVPFHYHNADAVIDPEFPAATAKEGGFLPDEYKDDSRWPTHCPCGYAFLQEDTWQVNVDRLYKGCPDGKLYVCRAFPPGAMWTVDWLDSSLYKGPDGKVWNLMLPGGVEWLVYGPAVGGGKWDVQGVPPSITVSPSINCEGVYHGHVKQGLVSEDCEGRMFPGVPRTA